MRLTIFTLASRLGKQQLAGNAYEVETLSQQVRAEAAAIQSGIPYRKHRPPRDGEQAEAVNSDKAMPVLPNSRHEKFALIVAKGKSRSGVYREVTGSAKNADANADNWLNAPGVRERVAELQEQTAEECGMERIDYAKSLVAMYQSPPSAASMDNPLCDVVHTKSGPRPVFASKISVGSELAKLCNWHKETTKLEAGDSILSFLDKVFGREDPPVRS